MNPPIYIVTQGEYSDYHIKAVFLDEQAAKDFVAICGGDIEDWQVGVPENAVYATIHCCQLWADDGSLRYETHPTYDYKQWVLRDVGLWRVNRAWNSREQGQAIQVYAQSTVSLEHARKLAAEGRQEWLRAGKPRELRSALTDLRARFSA